MFIAVMMLLSTTKQTSTTTTTLLLCLCPSLYSPLPPAYLCPFLPSFLPSYNNKVASNNKSNWLFSFLFFCHFIVRVRWMLFHLLLLFLQQQQQQQQRNSLARWLWNDYVTDHHQNDLHRAMQRSQSALSQQLMVLSATLLCLVFTRFGSSLSS